MVDFVKIIILSEHEKPINLTVVLTEQQVIDKEIVINLGVISVQQKAQVAIILMKANND